MMEYSIDHIADLRFEAFQPSARRGRPLTIASQFCDWALSPWCVQLSGRTTGTAWICSMSRACRTDVR